MGIRPGSNGFTLLELLVVMALCAILSTLATSAFSGMLKVINLCAATNAYFSSIHLARSEAIKRNARVTLCKSAQGDACDVIGGWEQGWIVFHDANENAMLDPGEEVVTRQGALPTAIRFTGNGPVANYVSYTATGNTKFSSGAFQAGTIFVCTESTTPANARQIVISSTGKVRTTKTVVSHCP